MVLMHIKYQQSINPTNQNYRKIQKNVNLNAVTVYISRLVLVKKQEKQKRKKKGTLAGNSIKKKKKIRKSKRERKKKVVRWKVFFP